METHALERTREEVYISVDVETAGPIPAAYSLLSLGACVVADPTKVFYVELKPINDRAVPEALVVSGFTLSSLAAVGHEPSLAMRSFEDWIRDVSQKDSPVFVGFNAGFDWAFVNWYFHHYLGANPFGFAPLDIKAYYMGLTRCRWDDTTSSRLPPGYRMDPDREHHALDDAIAQASLFAKLLRARSSASLCEP